ncbi:MAG TPA: MFS transporter [Phnomibacter sp.]|nr:MFS transporter [Phnomibacter sp.]
MVSGEQGVTAFRPNRTAVSAFFFISGFTFASWASRIPHLQSKLGLSEAMLGSVLLALPIGSMVSLLMAGALITKLGSKNVLLTAAGLYGPILISLDLAQNTWQLVTGLFFFGVAGNLFNISVNTQAVGVENMYRRPIMASFHGVWSLAGFTGAALGTLMVSLQAEPFLHFVISAFIGWVLIFLFHNSTIEPTDKGKGPAFAIPDKFILQLGLIAFCCLVCEGTMFDWSGVYFKKVVLAPERATTLGYAAFMGCMATGRFIADRFVMRLGSRNMLIASGLVIFTGLMLAVLLPTLLMATLGFMLVGFGVSSVVPIVYSMAGRSKTMHPGQALAAVSSVGFAGFLAGPPLIGLIAEASSLQWSFGIVALIGISTSLLAKKIL